MVYWLSQTRDQSWNDKILWISLKMIAYSRKDSQREEMADWMMGNPQPQQIRESLVGMSARSPFQRYIRLCECQRLSWTLRAGWWHRGCSMRKLSRILGSSSGRTSCRCSRMKGSSQRCMRRWRRSAWSSFPSWPIRPIWLLKSYRHTTRFDSTTLPCITRKSSHMRRVYHI